ncbi:MAG: hypothetical protein ACKVY0_05520 [Prosthecobacter sp.]|uniref:hypothetical protein n=1 Tax=Prosthecobacter sp. TaxID=1965333 RepID=UPI0039025261
MAKHGQQQQDTSANENQSSSGGRQAVVELCEISACGLVFWSRHRFEIGAEVQVRIKRSALLAACHVLSSSGSKWVMLKGLVVACPPQRRTDGSSGFEVSLLMEQALCGCMPPPKIPAPLCWFTPPLPGLRRFGLN